MSIVVLYDPFKFTSQAKLYKANGEVESLPLSSNVREMIVDLAALARQNEIYDIKFHGPAPIMDALKEDLTFSCKKIHIEQV